MAALPPIRRHKEEWEMHPERFKQVRGRISGKWILVRREGDVPEEADTIPWPNIEVMETPP